MEIFGEITITIENSEIHPLQRIASASLGSPNWGSISGLTSGFNI